ncbi:uncharacterized protein ACHE_21462S [Aspergillus chevalieri]|uniref:Uncharacterized protein n=1 Tax=Aspergillus chevalieri TaxID=182096 RepID=A0A7R7VLB7_ASPCH|nr:uncharacterized protein ACHE_21462S [Aspergillus chevalieri]BCR86004.1 hypothetical protein ACHE_21462S [Aspergillus chevalieri]
MLLTTAFENGGRTGLEYWTPNLNPRWSRVPETSGEDSRRIKGYAAHFLRAFEEDHGAVSKILAA